MELKHLVIRELSKEEGQTAVITDKGGIIQASPSLSHEIIASLNTAFIRRSTLTHGAFNEDNTEGYPFIQTFENYISGQQSDTDFLQLADTGLAQLAAAMSAPTSHNVAGGYIIFCQYQEDRFEYLLIALVRNRSAISLNEQLKPTEVDEVDFDKLHQAAKINITHFKQGKDSYLSFIGTKEKGNVTHYFANAFGCTDVKPSKQSTGDLIRAAKEFCTENNMYDQREQVVEDVVSYLSRQRADKKSALLPEVEQIFEQYIPPEQAETLTGTFGKFANSERYQVSHEFQPHTHTLNAMTKIKAKADNWQLDFSKRVLGDSNSASDIVFDEENQQIIIRRLSTRVMEQLRSALLSDDD